MQIVAAWVSESFHALELDPSEVILRPNFLTDLLQLCDLNCIAVGGALPEYIRRLPWVSQNGPSWLLRGKEEVYVIGDIMRFIEKDPDAISSAILFVK